MRAATDLARLEALLDAERHALREGRLAELPRFDADRVRLMQELARRSPSLDDLGRLRESVDRNARLMRATAHGIRDAIRRIAEIRAASGPIGSYSESGAPRAIGARPNAVERKA